MKTKLKTCSGCQKPKPIWKNVMTEDGRMRFCKGCYQNWSTQNQVSRPKPTSKPIRPRSSKRSKQEKLYSAKRALFLAEHPHCEIPVPGICTHKATDIHHVDGRVEDKLTDENGFKAACRKCHQWTHNNSEAARELGYLI